MPVVTKGHSFVVLLSADLRPLVVGLNRELAGRGAGPVGKEELPEIDRMLHEGLGAPASEASRCPHCRGYLSIDSDDDLICLNCGRPAAPRRELDDVIRKIAQRLLEYRGER